MLTYKNESILIESRSVVAPRQRGGKKVCQGLAENFGTSLSWYFNVSCVCGGVSMSACVCMCVCIVHTYKWQNWPNNIL